MELSSDSLMLYSRLPIKADVHCPGRSAPLSPPVTLRPRDGGSDRSDRVSQSHMSSFFFDTALLPTLLGILELECMHHRRSISCDRNAAPRLGKERDEKREVGRGRMEGRVKRERGGRSGACRHPAGTKASN